MTVLSPESDNAWIVWREQWRQRHDAIYLNHGSYGPPPEPVRRARRYWQDLLDREPMDFFVRILPSAWEQARNALAEFVGAGPQDLVFVENATTAMNLVADNFALKTDDEVLLTDHEYGAVLKIWRRACRRAGAAPKIATLPKPFRSADDVVSELFDHVTPKTRLMVVSHITSSSAVVLPVEEICRQARRRGVAVCIDGPHAVAQLPLDISPLGCDYYVASCHKWLSAPFGSGFLYVNPQHQSKFEPAVLSWGRAPAQTNDHWDDEFYWSGTRDPSAYLAIPKAIEFLREVPLDSFRARTHFLARYARYGLAELLNQEPLVPDCSTWYGSMTCLPLPPGTSTSLQSALWEQFHVEAPVFEFHGRPHLRVSCHLYNCREDIDQLLQALKKLLPYV